MDTIKEGRLTFSFSAGCAASRYDEWRFYRKHFNSVARSSKAVDIICITENVVWLIEVKDYCHHSRDKDLGIVDEIEMKMRDTLAGLAAASANADDPEKKFAQQALAVHHWRVILHLELPNRPLSIHPQPTEGLANTADNIRRQKTLRAIDKQPMVVSCTTFPPDIPWVATAT